MVGHKPNKLDTQHAKASVVNVSHARVGLDLISLHPRNYNKGDVDSVRESVVENGFYGSIVVQQSSGHVLVGNHRYMAAKAEGLTEIDVDYVDVDDDTAIRIMVADNATAARAKPDPERLHELLAEIQAQRGDLRGTGHDASATAKLLEQIRKQRQTFPRQHVHEWKDADGFFDMPAWLEPTWENATDVIVQFSGGKDSTAAALWASKHATGKRFQLAFVDPGVEFPGISAHVYDVAVFLHAECVVLKPQRDWWAWLAQEGRWPSIIYRPCANDMIHRTFGTYVRQHPEGTTVVLTGSRAEEANLGSRKTERSALQSLGSKSDKYQHFAPCFATKKATEDQIIESSGVPLWDGYKRGFIRTACWCCPGQCGLQAAALQHNYPGLADDIRRWEKRLGPMQPDGGSGPRSFDDLVRGGQKKLAKSG